MPDPHAEERTAPARGQGLILTLLMLAGIVNFLDRSSLSIANRTIRSELHLSATQMGLLLSSFSLAYGLMQLPVGPLLDRFGSRRVLGLGLGIWSSAQMAMSAVTGMATFVPVRILLGLGEAPFFPASVKVVREQFSARQRGRAMAAVNISTTIGQGIAPPLLTVLMLHFGWRPMVLIIGAIGVLLALAWFPLQRNQSFVSAPVSVSLAEWVGLFRQPRVWGLMLGFGGINYTGWFYIAWLPAYLQSAHGVSILASGWLTAIPFLAGSLGMLSSGVLTDRLGRRGTPLRTIHRRQILAGMVASACFTVLASRVASANLAVACISGALFCIHFAGTSAWGFVQAISPKKMVATVSSIQNFGSFVVASAAPLMTGWLLDRTHTFAAAFALCAAVTLVGAATYALMQRGELT